MCCSENKLLESQNDYFVQNRMIKYSISNTNIKRITAKYQSRLLMVLSALFFTQFFFLFYFSVLFNFCNTLPRRSSRNSYL